MTVLLFYSSIVASILLVLCLHFTPPAGYSTMQKGGKHAFTAQYLKRTHIRRAGLQCTLCYFGSSISDACVFLRFRGELRAIWGCFRHVHLTCFANERIFKSSHHNQLVVVQKFQSWLQAVRFYFAQTLWQPPSVRESECLCDNSSSLIIHETVNMIQLNCKDLMMHTVHPNVFFATRPKLEGCSSRQGTTEAGWVLFMTK